MKYLDLVNLFWKSDLEHPITPGDTRLYFYLLYTCNQLGWKMPFGHSDRHLSYLTGLSVPTVRESKKRLKDRGLIDFSVPKIKSKAFNGQCQFWFPTVQNSCTVPLTVDLPVPLTDSFTDTLPDSLPVPLTNTRKDKIRIEYNNPLYPLFEQKDFSEKKIENKNQVSEELIFPYPKKEKKRRKVAPKEEKEEKYVLPFPSRKFADTWNALLQKPKWENKKLKSLLLTLEKLSKYEESFAIHLLERAINNDWHGAVFPNTDFKYEQWKQNNVQNGNTKVNIQTRETKILISENCPPERNYKERF